MLTASGIFKRSYSVILRVHPCSSGTEPPTSEPSNHEVAFSAVAANSSSGCASELIYSFQPRDARLTLRKCPDRGQQSCGAELPLLNSLFLVYRANCPCSLSSRKLQGGPFNPLAFHFLAYCCSCYSFLIQKQSQPERQILSPHAIRADCSPSILAAAQHGGRTELCSDGPDTVAI
jgi:hypothetical protein